MGTKVYFTPRHAIYPAYGVIYEAGVPIPAIVVHVTFSQAMYVHVYGLMLLSGHRHPAYDNEVSISKPEE